MAVEAVNQPLLFKSIYPNSNINDSPTDANTAAALSAAFPALFAPLSDSTTILRSNDIISNNNNNFKKLIHVNNGIIKDAHYVRVMAHSGILYIKVWTARDLFDNLIVWVKRLVVFFLCAS